MNSTNSTEHYDKQEFPLSLAEKTVSFIFYSIFFLGLFFNIMLIWTCLTVRKLRTNHNALVINLAFADLIIIGYIMPCSMAALILDYYPLPKTICVFNGVLAYMCFSTSIFTLFCIALNRYIKICKNSYYDRIFTDRATKAMMVGCWILGFILCAPSFFYKDGIVYDKTFQMCIPNRYIKGVYTIISMVVVCPLPIYSACICYIAIYRHFRNVRGGANQVLPHGAARTRRIQNIAVARSCFVVFFTSVLAFTPFSVIDIFLRKSTDVPVAVQLFATVLCFSNSAANSIVYGFMNREIRKNYRLKLKLLFHSNRVTPANTGMASSIQLSQSGLNTSTSRTTHSVYISSVV